MECDELIKEVAEKLVVLKESITEFQQAIESGETGNLLGNSEVFKSIKKINQTSSLLVKLGETYLSKKSLDKNVSELEFLNHGDC